MLTSDLMPKPASCLFPARSGTFSGVEELGVRRPWLITVTRLLLN